MLSGRNEFRTCTFIQDWLFNWSSDYVLVKRKPVGVVLLAETKPGFPAFTMGQVRSGRGPWSLKILLGRNFSSLPEAP